MLNLAFVLLLVDDVGRSAAFYREVLGIAPSEQSPTFAMFAPAGSVALGLWSKHTVAPPPAAGPGASEIAFVVEDVDAVTAGWQARGLSIAQAATMMDFGRTAVALDPDGHRIRVLTPASAG